MDRWNIEWWNMKMKTVKVSFTRPTMQQILNSVSILSGD